jgi:hypothetical protein
MRLNYDGDKLADRLTLTLPAKFARAHSTSVWKMLRSIAEVFGIATTGIDELYQQTNTTSATGEFLDNIIVDNTKIIRKQNETDGQYRVRYFRNLFVYNSTKQGMKEITFDIMGEYPVALVDKERGAFWNSKQYYGDMNGGSHYGKIGGDPFVGWIILKSKPSASQIDELCSVIKKYKALGVRIFLKWRKYDMLTGLTYEEIAVHITEQPRAKVSGNHIAPKVYGDFYDSRRYYNDTFKPSLYGGISDYTFVYLAAKPSQGVLDELVEVLGENLVYGDKLAIVYPN